MTRIVALVVLILIALYIYERMRRALAEAQLNRRRSQQGRGGPASEPIALVPCARCGVRVAEDRTLAARDGSPSRYCSAGCRDQGA